MVLELGICFGCLVIFNRLFLACCLQGFGLGVNGFSRAVCEFVAFVVRVRVHKECF